MTSPFSLFAIKRSKLATRNQAERVVEIADEEDRFQDRLGKLVQRTHDDKPLPHAPGEKPSEGLFGKRMPANKPGMSPVPVIERAYQLAQSGQSAAIGDIRNTLLAEGYESVEGHLAGFSIRQQLRVVIRGAAQKPE